MHAYFRNHQLYLAEKFTWMDRQVQKSSKRALMKIESFKLIVETADEDQIELVKRLVKDSLLTPVPGRTVLQKEGFFASNTHN
ncbi:MAG: hypothetical protein C4329_01860 [Chitinophagaceae bacterium]